MTPPAAPSSISSSTATPTTTRTPFRTTLSNWGQAVTGRRLMRRRLSNGSDSHFNSQTSQQQHTLVGGNPSHHYPQSHYETSPSVDNNIHSTTIGATLSRRPTNASNASPRQPVSPRSSSIQSSQHHHRNSPSDVIRRSIRSALVNRVAFEPAFQSLTNEVLSGNSDVPIIAIDELFKQLRSTTTPLPSKALGLELLDALVVLDVRCLNAVATNTSGLRLLVDLGAAAKATDLSNSLPISLSHGSTDSEIRHLTNTAERVLLHWEGFVSESGSRLPSQSYRLVEAARSMSQRSSSAALDPLAGRVSEQSAPFVPTIQTTSVPIVAAPPSGRSPTQRGSTRVSQRDPSHRQIPLPPPPPMQPMQVDVPRVEEQLATTFSLIELTQETIKQAQGPGAKGMVEDLVKQCEKERKALTELMARAADSSDYVLFDQIQKIEADLKNTIDSAHGWIRTNTAVPPPPSESPRSSQALQRQPSSSLTSPPASEPLPFRDEGISPAASTGRKKKRKSLSPKNRRPEQRLSDSFEQPVAPPSVTDDFTNPFPSEPFTSQRPPTAWPPPATEAPLTPLAPVPTEDDFFSGAAWHVDFPSSTPSSQTPTKSSTQPPPPQHDPFVPRSPPQLNTIEFFTAPTPPMGESPRPPPIESPRRMSLGEGQTFEGEQVESDGSVERRRRKKKKREGEGGKRREGRRAARRDGSQDSIEQRPEGVEFVEISPAAETSSTVERLKNKIKNLEDRLATFEVELRPRIEAEVRAQMTIDFNHQLSMFQAAHDATRREVDELKKELKEREDEMESLKKDMKKREHELDRVKYDLADREKAVVHAKEMWMRENGRAAQVSDNLDELEKKLLDKESQLISLSKKYQDVSRETAALKNLVKADLDDFDSPSKVKSSLFPSIRSERRSRPLPSTTGSLPIDSSPSIPRIDSRSPHSQVLFYSVDEEYSPTIAARHSRQSHRLSDIPSFKSPSRRQERSDDGVTRHYQSEDPRGPDRRSTRLTNAYASTPPFISSELNPSGRRDHRDPFGLSGLDWQDISTEVSPSILLEKDEEDTLERYRTLLSSNDEILYEDSTLQIGMKASYKGLTATINLFYGNHCPSELQSFNVTFQLINDHDNNGALALTHSQLPHVLGARQQLSQSLIVTCSEPYDYSPILRLHYLLPDNSPALIQLPLPIPITKFVEGRHLEFDDFFRFWKHEEFMLKEVTALIHLDRKRYRRSLLLVAKAIQLNGALRLLPGVDPSEDNLVFSGIFPPSNTDIAIPTSLILVRYESGTGRYRDVARLSIRSDSLVLARALRSILTSVLAIPTRDCLPAGLHC